MNRARFQALAQAYGGDLRRWPAAERSDAEAFVAADRDLADRMLAAELGLDQALDADAATPPSPAVRRRILAAAPVPRARPPVWRWAAAAGLGLGLAASCAAGVAAGLTLAPASLARLVAGPPAADDVNGLVNSDADAGVG